MSVQLAITVATNHADLMKSADQLVAAGFLPIGAPYVPPFETPIEGEEAGKPQIAWAFARSKQDIAVPTLVPPGFASKRH